MPRIIKMAKGTYTASSITVDGEGRVITASSGAGGAGMGIQKQLTVGPASGTYTANPAASYLTAQIGGAGGGGGGNARQGTNSGTGGAGGYGYYTGPVTGGDPYAYNVGAGGTGGTGPPSGNAGSAGASTTLTNFGTANGGNGGNRTFPGSGANGNAGTSGSAPGADYDIGTGSMLYQAPGIISPGSRGPPTTGAGGTGGHGYLLIYENIGI